MEKRAFVSTFSFLNIFVCGNKLNAQLERSYTSGANHEAYMDRAGGVGVIRSMEMAYQGFHLIAVVWGLKSTNCPFKDLQLCCFSEKKKNKQEKKALRVTGQQWN